MKIGDFVLVKKINNNQKMMVADIFNDTVICRYVTNIVIKDMYLSKDLLILESEFEQWNKQQIRKMKIKKIYEE